eukprot:scaffold67214_cov53-Attheya_sp.AAC.3
MRNTHMIPGSTNQPSKFVKQRPPKQTLEPARSRWQPSATHPIFEEGAYDPGEVFLRSSPASAAYQMSTRYKREDIRWHPRCTI